MSAFDLIIVPIVRRGKTKLPDLSYAETEAPIPNSPAGGWSCRYYRKKVAGYHGRDEAQQGTETVDLHQTLSIQDPSCQVKTGDIAILPADTVSSVQERALVIRRRQYSRCVQCDIETGATVAAAPAP